MALGEGLGSYCFLAWTGEVNASLKHRIMLVGTGCPPSCSCPDFWGWVLREMTSLGENYSVWDPHKSRGVSVGFPALPMPAIGSPLPLCPS